MVMITSLENLCKWDISISHLHLAGSIRLNSMNLSSGSYSKQIFSLLPEGWMADYGTYTPYFLHPFTFCWTFKLCTYALYCKQCEMNIGLFLNAGHCLVFYISWERKLLHVVDLVLRMFNSVFHVFSHKIQ